MQVVDTQVKIPVNLRRQVPTERKSVEVARTQHSMMFKPVPVIDREAEAQLNRVRSNADTSSSETRADSVQKSREASGRVKHLERRAFRQRKDS